MSTPLLLRRCIIMCVVFCSGLDVRAQLHPGFDPAEYLEMLRITAQQVDTPFRGTVPSPQHFERIFQSVPTALDNRWDLWVDPSKTTMVVSIRGTTLHPASWLENFYAAMIPAKGHLQIDDSTAFNYQLAADPKAAVHVGWTVGLATMAPGIVQKIKECNSKWGIKQLIIMGHSQGGAMAFLLRSYLFYQQTALQLPTDLVIKTYCSAAPKPGNLYYAYDFDYITRSGWAFTVVNAADWVPETPFSLQTLQDFNALNPFTDVKKQLGKQSFLVRMYLRHVFNRLDKTSRKAQRNFTKYLGSRLYTQVRKYLPQLKQPDYSITMNYMRAGAPVVLMPDSTYYQQYPETQGSNVFLHHGFWPYYLLTQRIYGAKE